MDYPTVPSYIRLNKRDERWLWRRQAAWNLVHHKFGEVTEDEYERAFNLLNRCIRYALASWRFDESETEANWNSTARKRKEEQLERRCERLCKELEYYDATIGWASNWPTVVDLKAKNEHQFVKVCNLWDLND